MRQGMLGGERKNETGGCWGRKNERMRQGDAGGGGRGRMRQGDVGGGRMKE